MYSNHLINYNFSQAAKNYYAHAEIQKQVAKEVLNAFCKYYQEGLVLDLGSGPGTIAKLLNNQNLPILEYDLSLSMLKQSSQRFRINGEASNLPFKDKSFSFIISNLMLQWPEKKACVIEEIFRVLKTSSMAIVSVPIIPSLYELNCAWQQVDRHKHTLEFYTDNAYHELFIQAGFTIFESYSWCQCCYFTDIKELLYHFKNTGTNLLKSQASKGLGGRRLLDKLAEAYQDQLTQEGLLPLSYYFLRLIVIKE